MRRKASPAGIAAVGMRHDLHRAVLGDVEAVDVAVESEASQSFEVPPECETLLRAPREEDAYRRIVMCEDKQ